MQNNHKMANIFHISCKSSNVLKKNIYIYIYVYKEIYLLWTDSKL